MKGIWKGSIVGLIAAGVLSATIIVQPVRTAAQGFLDQFHVQQLTPIAIDPTTLQHLPNPPQPSQLGSFSYQAPQLKQGTTLSEAEKSLPQGGIFQLQAPGWSLSHRELRTDATATLVLDRAKAENYLQSAGWPNATLPTSLDGARVQIIEPALLTTVWSDKDQQKLFLVQGSQPELQLPPGVDPAFLRTLLTQTPGLPQDLRQQLQQMDWTHALPIPIPKGAQETAISLPQAKQALLITDPQQQKGSVVVWLASDETIGALYSDQLTPAALQTLAAQVVRE